MPQFFNYIMLYVIKQGCFLSRLVEIGAGSWEEVKNYKFRERRTTDKTLLENTTWVFSLGEQKMKEF